MTSAKRFLPALTVALTLFGSACSSSPAKPASGVVETTTSSAPAGMSFAECQKSAEYPGGKYAVSYDNGVCTVQKPAETPTTAATALSFSSCADAKAAGYSNLHKGDPGYSTKLDRDGDGVACDN